MYAEVLAHPANEELRVQAALGLGEFTDINGVLSTLNTISLAQTESIDLRYTAFTSFERGGLKPECIQLLRQISTACLSVSYTLGRRGVFHHAVIPSLGHMTFGRTNCWRQRHTSSACHSATSRDL
jgi:hypothetical protein